MPRVDRLLSGLLLLLASAQAAERPLTVVSWGGAYQAAQQEALLQPYTAATGVELEVKRYSGGLDAFRQRAAAEGWDVVDMLEDQAIAACEAGLLRPIEARSLHPSLPWSALRDDFVTGAWRRCSVAQNLYAVVIGYDQRAFTGVKPSRVEDFFDLEAFPGRRALQKSPDVALEWALMAEGVPVRQVYDLLSTDRGLRLAFRKLDTIRDAIVWWQDPAAPAALLRDGRAALASGYNGRFFSAFQERGAPISVVWDGRVIGYEVWAIPATSDQPERALAFLRFATLPEPMAALAERIPYGPARYSALARVGLHPRTGVMMRHHLPNAPHHGERALVRDSVWYAHTEALRQRRFVRWLGENGQ